MVFVTTVNCRATSDYWSLENRGLAYLKLPVFDDVLQSKFSSY